MINMYVNIHELYDIISMETVNTTQLKINDSAPHECISNSPVFWETADNVLKGHNIMKTVTVNTDSTVNQKNWALEATQHIQPKGDFMIYSTIVFTGGKFGRLTNSIVNQLERHFEVWASEDPDSTFEFKWIKDSLIFRTNSSELFSKWLMIENEYMNYMLSEDQMIFAVQYEDYDYANVA